MILPFPGASSWPSFVSGVQCRLEFQADSVAPSFCLLKVGKGVKIFFVLFCFCFFFGGSFRFLSKYSPKWPNIGREERIRRLLKQEWKKDLYSVDSSRHLNIFIFVSQSILINP